MMADGNYTYHGEHFIVYRIVKSLCCTPKTNYYVLYQLYVNEKKIQLFSVIGV